MLDDDLAEVDELAVCRPPALPPAPPASQSVANGTFGALFAQREIWGDRRTAYAAARGSRARHPAAARGRARPARRGRPRDRARRRRRHAVDARGAGRGGGRGRRHRVRAHRPDRRRRAPGGAPEAPCGRRRRGGLRQHRRGDRDRTRHRGVQHARRPRRDHRRSRVLPDPGGGAAHVRRGGRPSTGTMAGLPHEPVPRPGRARPHARCGGVRSHRPSRRPPRRGVRHGSAPPHAPRHRIDPDGSPISTTCSASPTSSPCTCRSRRTRPGSSTRDGSG